MFKILIAESDYTLSRSLTRTFLRGGYEVETAFDGSRALDIACCEYFDLIVCDAALSALDGFALTGRLRTAGIIMPIILLSDVGGKEMLRQAFVSGADEFLTKPVDTEELLLRTSALLRRAQMVSDRQRMIGSTLIDYDTMTVSYKGKSVMLPLKEFFLLYKLCSFPGRVVSRQHILDDIWGYESTADSHTVDVHICRLRSRLGDNDDIKIETVRGIGYKLAKKSV